MVILLPWLYAGIKDMNDHNCLFYFLNVLERKESRGEAGAGNLEGEETVKRFSEKPDWEPVLHRQ